MSQDNTNLFKLNEIDAELTRKILNEVCASFN